MTNFFNYRAVHGLLRVIAASVLMLTSGMGAFLHHGQAQQGSIKSELKPELVVQVGHFGDIIAIKYSPNGQMMASGSEDNTVKIWDVASGKILYTLLGHKNYITSLDFSSNNEILVTASKDNTIRLWDLRTGKEIRTLPGHGFYASAVAFSPVNNIVASASIDNTVKLWDIRNGREIPIPVKHTKSVNSLCFSPDGMKLLTGSDDKTIKILNIPTNSVNSIDVDGEVVHVTYSADGSLFAAQCAGSGEQNVIIWDAAKQTILRRVQGFGKQIAISPNGRLLASIGLPEEDEDRKHAIVLWNALNGKKLRALNGNDPRSICVTFSPDGSKVLSGGADKMIRTFDATSGREGVEYNGYRKVIKSLAFNKQGTALVSAHSDKEGNNFRVWDLDKGNEPGSIKAPLIQIESIMFSQDGSTLVAGGTSLDNKSLALWNAQTGKLIKAIKTNDYPIRGVGISPDGASIAVGTIDSVVQIYNIAQGTVSKQLSGHLKTVNIARYSPDGKIIATGSMDKTIRLWDAASGKELRKLTGHTEWVNTLAFSPDGKQLVSGSADRTLRTWDIATGQSLKTFTGHNGEVLCVGWSGNGRYIASGASDNVVRLWDPVTAKETRAFRGHANWVTALAFHPESKILASASADAKVLLWNLDNGLQMATLVGMDNGDWAVITPDGQFDGSEDGTKLLHWVVDQQPVQLDAFFERFYSPKLLMRLFPASPAALALAKQQKEQEAKARAAAEAKAKRDAEEFARKEMELKKQQEAEAKVRAEAEIKAKREAEELARKEAEIKKKQEAEAKARAEAEAKAQREAAELAKKQQLAKEQAERDALAKQQAEAKARAEAEAKVRAEAEAKARAEAEKLAQEKARLEKEAKERAAAEERARVEAELLAKKQADLKAKEEAAKKDPPPVAGLPVAQKLDINKNFKLPPMVDILAPRSGDTLTTVGRVNITIGVKDRGAAIAEIRIFQNGKLLFPEEFTNIPSAPGYTILRDYVIQLLPGRNDLRVIAINSDRTESNPAEVTVEYKTAPITTNLHIVALGVDAYLNKEYTLRFSKADAKSLMDKLEQEGKKSYDKVFRYELYDEQVRRENVEKLFKDVTAKAQRQDVFVFFYAGHGKSLTTDDQATFYLVMQDVKSLDELPTRGISAKELSVFFQQVPAGKQLITFDACQSATAVDDFVQSKSMKGMARKTGSGIIASAGAEEAANEDTKLGHGLFTHALLKALDGGANNGKGKVTVDALKRYVENEVPELAHTLFKGKEQNPYGQLSGKDFEITVITKK